MGAPKFAARTRGYVLLRQGAGHHYTTRAELGKELGRGSPIVLGIDKSFDRPFDIETQAHLEQPELPIYHTLDETVVAAAALARQIRAKEN